MQKKTISESCSSLMLESKQFRGKARQILTTGVDKRSMRIGKICQQHSLCAVFIRAEDVTRMSAPVSQGSSNSPSWEVWLCQNDYIKFKAMTTGYLYMSVRWKQTDYFQPNVWYHVAVVKNGDNLRLYVNGTLKNSEDFLIPNISMRNSNADLTIGHSCSKNDFKGYIDKIRINKGSAEWTEDFIP